MAEEKQEPGSHADSTLPPSGEREAAIDESPATTATDADAGGSEETASDKRRLDDVGVPEFAELKERMGRQGSGSLDHFLDVHVPVWAELGRVELPLGQLVELAEGSVVRLDRPVSEPVDVVSQGVKLARGEIIVVDDCFAVRIKEIVAKK